MGIILNYLGIILNYFGYYGYWVLGTGYWVLGTGYWVLGTGYWVLGTGYWVLGTGYWVLGTGYWVPREGTLTAAKAQDKVCKYVNFMVNIQQSKAVDSYFLQKVSRTIFYTLRPTYFLKKSPSLNSPPLTTSLLNRYRECNIENQLCRTSEHMGWKGGWEHSVSHCYCH